MASPAVVGTPTETAISTAATSHVVNLPNGATGNLLVAVMNKGNVSATVNALAGWNELLDEASANGLYIAYRTCDGTEGATTTFTLSANTRGAWIVYEISGHIDPGTQAPQVGTTASGSSTTPNPPSVSVTGGSKPILTIACFGRDGEEADDDTWVTAAPSGFGSLRQKACGTAGTNLGGMIATAHLAQTTATADPATFTCATGGWRAQTIVIHGDPTIYVTPTPATVTNAAQTIAYNHASLVGSPTHNGDGTTTIDDTGADEVKVSSAFLDETQGWIAVRFKVGFNTSANDVGIWGFGPSSSSALLLYYRALVPGWDVRRETSGASLQLTVSDTVATNDDVTLVMAWTSTTIKLSVDGAAFSSQGNTEIPNLVETFFTIGTAPNDSGAINSPVYWFATGSGTLSDSDAATIHGFGNSDPVWGSLPGTPTMIWKADDATLIIENPGNPPITVTPATETDAAQAITFTKTIFKDLTAATESDAAVALSLSKTVTVAPSAETDTAVAVTFSQEEGDIVVDLTPATESDAAVALALHKTVTLTPGTESDAAVAQTISKIISLVQATETDSAQAVTASKSVALVPKTETDSAVAVSVHKLVVPVTATETDSAQPVTFTKTIFVTVLHATESDVAVAITIEGDDVVFTSWKSMLGVGR